MDPQGNGLAWDRAQETLINAPPQSCVLVEAPPGTGKTAVACARAAQLLKMGVPGSGILLVSFTRTAVAELRNRIASACGSAELAAALRISTLDSYAWSLNVGFTDQSVPAVLKGYDANIERVIDLFRAKSPDLLDWMQQLVHVVIDEYQDILGLRAQLLEEIIRSLRDDCGVTIFADSAQAIYGFTADGQDASETQLPSSTAEERYLALLTVRDFTNHALQRVFRTNDDGLLRLLGEARKAVLETGVNSEQRLVNVRSKIEALAGRNDRDDHDDIRGREDTLVLYRRRAEVMLRSSFLSSANVEHRLRMSGLPLLPKPWIACVFDGKMTESVDRGEFEELWNDRYVPHLFGGEAAEPAWALLRRFASTRRGESIDLSALREVLARERPPSELCEAEFGRRGPILGTIHASKGREADRVLLMLPSAGNTTGGTDLEEESRVLYVGASRARHELSVGRGYGSPSGYLESGRVYRVQSTAWAAQVEVGRDGDFERGAQMRGGNSKSAISAVRTLSASPVEVVAHASPASGFSHQVFAKLGNTQVHIATFSESLKRDLWEVARAVGRFRGRYGLKPALRIQHLYMVGAATEATAEGEGSDLDLPYRVSGMFLAPAIRGFPLVFFNVT